MRVIEPVLNLQTGQGVGEGFSTPNLVSISIPSDGDPVWDPATVYQLDDKVLYGFIVYRALSTTTAGALPSDTPLEWFAEGYENRYKMFDGSTRSKSIDLNNDIVVTMNTRGVTALALFEVIGTTVRVVVEDPIDGIVYDKTRNTNIAGAVDGGIVNWYQYFFNGFPDTSTSVDMVIDDLPNYGNATVTITIDQGSIGQRQVGLILAGKPQDIGTTQWGLSAGIIDYSLKSVNSFGDFTVVKRAFSKRADFDIQLPTSKVSNARKRFIQLRTTPCLYIGDRDYESTIIFGYFKDFEVVLEDYHTSSCSLTVEGL